jgi:chromosomal replication initiation ATPase DnaA
MLKQVDLRPNHALDRKELIKKVYDLSEEVERLQKKIEHIRNKPLKTKTVYIREEVEKKVVNVFKKKEGENLSVDFDFVVFLTGISERKMKMKNRKLANVRARSMMYYILHKQGYTLISIGKIFNRDHSTIIHGLQKYQVVVPETWKNEVDEYIHQMYNL